MSAPYPLKKADPFSIIESLMDWLTRTQPPNIVDSMREPLNLINQLRNKVCTFELPKTMDIGTIDKYITTIEMYVRYSLLIAKHFDWGPQSEDLVRGFVSTW
jgi:hypothetical protein